MTPKCESSCVRSISREVDLAWLAGIIDGEGALSVNLKMAHNGVKYLQPKVRIFNTDPLMIQKASEIYEDLNLRFCYTVAKPRKEGCFAQIGILVSSQGSSLKLLRALHPYLINKKTAADKMMEVIEYVRSLPKGGGAVSRSYENDQKVLDGISEFAAIHGSRIDPSTTTRRANRKLVLVR